LRPESGQPNLRLVVPAPPEPEPSADEPGDRRVLLAALRVVGGRDVLRFVTLTAGESAIVGRDPSCGLVVDEPTVSRRHARVACQENGDVVLEDLGSFNGVTVNGVRLERAKLVAGDHIELGTAPLRLDMLSRDEISQLASVLARFDQPAADPHTGLVSGAWIHEDLPGEIARSEQEGSELCLLLLGVDDFDELRHRHGAAVMDDVLREFARLLIHSVRDTDPAVRYGEHRALVLVHGGADAAAHVVRRIRAAVAGHDWSRLAEGLAVSVSVGVAPRPIGATVPTWILGAEEALLADRRGRAGSR